VIAPAVIVDPVLLPERRRILLFTNSLLGLLCFSYIGILVEIPGVQDFEYALFAGAGASLLLLAGLSWKGWLPYLPAAALTVGVGAVPLLERIVTVFVGPLLDTPGQSAFMPVFSYYVLLYLTIVVLLPYPWSARAGIAAWLLMAVLTSALSLPHWSAPAPPPLLGALLIYVWVGHGALVVLIFSAARTQSRLVAAQAAAVEAERDARQLAQRAETQWARQQQVLNFHIRNTPLAVIEWTPDFRLCGWSPRAEEIFGWKADEVLGKSPLEWHFIHEEDRQTVAATEERIFEQRDRLVVCYNRNYRKDGSVAHCCWYNSIKRDEAGEVLSFFSLVDDISTEHQFAQRLSESETLLRGLFEQAGVGIALLDAQGQWLSVNQRLCEITGYSEVELTQLDLKTITHPDDRGRDLELAARMLRGDIPGYRNEKRYCRKDGSEVWVVLNARRIESVAGSSTHYVKVIEDISELKATEARVQALNASLEQRVAQRTAQLRETINDAERRGRDLGSVAEMTGLLSGARDQKEAMKIVAHTGRQLFPDTEMGLYLLSDQPDRFVLREYWGSEREPVTSFLPSECWAVRRGREHRVEDREDQLRCKHHSHDSLRPQTCLPLVALGETIGVLTLRWTPRPDGWAPEPLLLRSLAEQVGLAIGNVRLREELHKQSVRDPVTGLESREQLEAQLHRRIAEQARGGRGFSLLRLDVDGYTDLVERFGPEATEGLLREVSDLLRSTARVEELLYRHGPGEFALVLLGDDPEQAQRAAERLQAQIRGLQFSPHRQPLPPVLLASGSAFYPRDASSAEQLLQQANESLAAARKARRLQPRGEGQQQEIGIR